MPIRLLWALQFATVAVGAVINTLPAAGEEIGWRGYLFPRLLDRLGPGLAVLVSGVIWGLWHAPLILLGYNYPSNPVLGLAAMCVFTTGIGAILAWLAQRGGSIWPAALGHGALNAAAGGFMIIFADADFTVDTLSGTILGWGGWPVLVVAVVVLLVCRAFLDPVGPQPGREGLDQRQRRVGVRTILADDPIEFGRHQQVSIGQHRETARLGHHIGMGSDPAEHAVARDIEGRDRRPGALGAVEPGLGRVQVQIGAPDQLLGARIRPETAVFEPAIGRNAGLRGDERQLSGFGVAPVMQHLARVLGVHIDRALVGRVGDQVVVQRHVVGEGAVGADHDAVQVRVADRLAHRRQRAVIGDGEDTSDTLVVGRPEQPGAVGAQLQVDR